MMPLWTTATRSVACGCALVSVGRPCVAQRVWPMPLWPFSGSLCSRASRFFSLPSARRRSSRAVLERGDAGRIIAAIFQPLQRIDEMLRDRALPRIPIIPHMRFSVPAVIYEASLKHSAQESVTQKLLPIATHN